MSKTFAEKLRDNDGKPVLCDECHKKRTLDATRWMMTSDRRIICPECQTELIRKGVLLVSV